MRRQTLLKKLVVSFILVSLIPALLTAGVTFYRNNRDLKASIISENQLSLLDISVKIKLWPSRNCARKHHIVRLLRTCYRYLSLGIMGWI